MKPEKRRKKHLLERKRELRLYGNNKIKMMLMAYSISKIEQREIKR
jgi:hypothetical protein